MRNPPNAFSCYECTYRSNHVIEGVQSQAQISDTSPCPGKPHEAAASCFAETVHNVAIAYGTEQELEFFLTQVQNR